MAQKKLSTEQRIDLWKSVGRGLIDLFKSNKAAGYALTSLGILGLGKMKLISCKVGGTLQGVSTYIAIGDVVEEGDSGFFGIGGMGETIAKGGTSTLIGALWAEEIKKNCFDLPPAPPLPSIEDILTAPPIFDPGQIAPVNDIPSQYGIEEHLGYSSGILRVPYRATTTGPILGWPRTREEQEEDQTITQGLAAGVSR